MMTRPRSGFTLLELLVTVSLMALIAAACVGALEAGLRVWRRAATVGTSEQAVLLAFERIRKDVEGARRFSPLPFQGRLEELAFAAIGHVTVKDAEGPRELGRLGYYVDQRNHMLCRSFMPYRSMKRSRLQDRCQVVLEDVVGLRLSYFGSTETDDTPSWSARWESGEPPEAVKVTLLTGAASRAPTPHSFIVTLMTATMPKDNEDS